MIKGIIKKIIYNNKSTSEKYISYLRKKGVLIGEGCRIFAPLETHIDTQNPYLLQIGNNVRITKGVTILTHDYSWSVLSEIEGNIIGGVSKVTIGNNVFIGMNSIILRGSIIGDNIIIGAGSIVSGNLLSNSVYAGNPAKRIMSIEDFYKKRCNLQISEAVDIAREYFKRTGNIPDENILREYFFIYKNRNEKLSDREIKLIKGTGREKEIMNFYRNSKPEFDGLDNFLKYCNLHR